MAMTLVYLLLKEKFKCMLVDKLKTLQIIRKRRGQKSKKYQLGKIIFLLSINQAMSGQWVTTLLVSVVSISNTMRRKVFLKVFITEIHIHHSEMFVYISLNRFEIRSNKRNLLKQYAVSDILLLLQTVAKCMGGVIIISSSYHIPRFSAR